MTRKKITILDLQKKKEQTIPITMLTAYDYSAAVFVDESEIDTILVVESLDIVMLGLDSTVPVTMDEMIHHCRAVARGVKYAFLIGDMPFMSYQSDNKTAVLNAGRFLKEANMDAVKLEGGQEVVPTIQAIIRAGIPVMGHIGLTPQSISKLGGYRIQGKSVESAIRLLHDALALEEAGCFSIVLEAVPAPIALEISRRLKIPTIGIGAGTDCDGQVLVYHDILGMFDKLQPRFVKQYANLKEIVVEAFVEYRKDVIERRFPSEEHTYSIKLEELEAFLNESQKF